MTKLPAKKKAKAASPALSQTIDVMAEIGEDKASSGELTEISNLVAEAVALQAKITHREGLLKLDYDNLSRLVNNVIPQKMKAAGAKEITTTAGVIVAVDTYLTGSLPKEDEEKRKAAIEWLFKNGGKDIIKRTFSVALGKGDSKIAVAVRRALKKLKVPMSEKEDVHPSTLKSFANEKLRGGEDIPLEQLGLFSITSAKLTMPKEEKK